MDRAKIRNDMIDKDTNTIRLALAVNNDGIFENKHFGEAERFHIYEWNNDTFTFLNDEINPFKNADEEREHGVKEKGKGISNFLKSLGTQVIVSKQFGKNFKIVSKYFIPVVVVNSNPEEIIPLLNNYIDWFFEELNGKTENYKLLNLKHRV
jgi:predicted Fe-Mo cluster-binding NifX family protein